MENLADLKMETNQPILLLADKLDIPVKQNDTEEKLFFALAEYLEQVIQTDFNKLLGILYRVDVAEEKVRQALAENKNQSSGQVIATLLIEREQEKIKTRALYRNK
ncbi:hypothetical protein C1631_002760 [Chryseobacterium phosphatilyticum]|uniref:Uncharacterized protein n=2 Tax=Chryseobacterium phosphatilyticum TaxID=475075 RepID=A0A316XCM5_9FLAO|nr:hypothetical protein C1631_002760 [Chryseobacterium phosphatilyticum]